MAISRYEHGTDIFRPFFDDFMAPFGRMGSTMRMPDTDVVELEHEIRVQCELPGMNADDLEVDLENNVLTISGEKREEREEGEPGGTYHLSERRWGRFNRSFILPREVEQERIEATFADGVLTVRIPKTERARRRRIEIGDGGERGQRVEAKTGGNGGNR